MTSTNNLEFLKSFFKKNFEYTPKQEIFASFVP